MRKTILVAIFALLAATASRAALVLDQEQATIELGTSGEGFLVGGDPEYMLAQTVTAGVNGRLTRIEIPAVCESGTLVVEIRNVVAGAPPGPVGILVPGSTVLTRGEADATEFPASGGFVFRPIDLDRSVRMAAGDQFAIVLKNETGRCGVGFASPGIDLYPRGDSFFRYVFTSADVWLQTASPWDPYDIAFRTFVETGSGRRAGFSQCVVTGFRPPLPIPSFTPVCRCVQDASLREARCGFFHPSVFLVRTLPSPLPASGPFEVRWTLFALKPLTGIVEVDDVLPPGFRGSKSPLVFFGGQVPVGESLTLAYEAMAGPKSGRFKVDTNVAIVSDQEKAEKGQIRTVIEVAPK